MVEVEAVPQEEEAMRRSPPTAGADNGEQPPPVAGASATGVTTPPAAAALQLPPWAQCEWGRSTRRGRRLRGRELDVIRATADAEALAFMKVGRHLGRLKALLSEAGLLGHAVYVERASLPNQRVVPLLELDEDRAPYFSMVLVHRRGGAHVL